MILAAVRTPAILLALLFFLLLILLLIFFLILGLGFLLLEVVDLPMPDRPSWETLVGRLLDATAPGSVLAAGVPGATST